MTIKANSKKWKLKFLNLAKWTWGSYIKCTSTAWKIERAIKIAYLNKDHRRQRHTCGSDASKEYNLKRWNLIFGFVLFEYDSILYPSIEDIELGFVAMHAHIRFSVRNPNSSVFSQRFLSTWKMLTCQSNATLIWLENKLAYFSEEDLQHTC